MTTLDSHLLKLIWPSGLFERAADEGGMEMDLFLLILLLSSIDSAGYSLSYFTPLVYIDMLRRAGTKFNEKLWNI